MQHRWRQHGEALVRVALGGLVASRGSTASVVLPPARRDRLGAASRTGVAGRPGRRLVGLLGPHCLLLLRGLTLRHQRRHGRPSVAVVVTGLAVGVAAFRVESSAVSKREYRNEQGWRDGPDLHGEPPAAHCLPVARRTPPHATGSVGYGHPPAARGPPTSLAIAPSGFSGAGAWQEPRQYLGRERASEHSASLSARHLGYSELQKTTAEEPHPAIERSPSKVSRARLRRRCEDGSFCLPTHSWLRDALPLHARTYPMACDRGSRPSS